MKYRTPRPLGMAVPDFGKALIPGRPTPTAEQYAIECELARAYLSRNAPDLLAMLFGRA